MPKGTTKQKKILVVDDDPLIIRMYEHKLVQDGHEVLLAFNGADAILIAKEKKPDLILLDLMMPKMNGIETLKFLNKESDTKKIPVVVLTNIGDDAAYKKAAVDLGAVDYLVKVSTSLKQLGEKVQVYLKKKSS